MAAAKRSRTWAVALGLFGFAFAIRLLPAPTVFHAAGAHFTGNDAYYHMRRVLYGLAHFPDWLDFDPYLNFPDGARPIWTPVFDWLSTLFVLPLDAAGGTAAAEWGAALIPALLGAACAPLLYRAARRVFEETIARLAAVLAALLGAHVWYSQVGFFDHHAAVALAAVVMLGAALRFVSAPPTLGASLGVSLSQAFALLLWPGMLLHLALTELGIVLAAVRDREAGGEAMRLRSIGHLLALLLVAPLCLGQSWPQWGDYSPTVLTRFQPWLFSALAAHAAGCAVSWRSLGRGAPGRSGVVAGVALAAVGASLATIPGLADAAGEAWRWLGKREPFQASVSESTSILRYQGSLSLYLLLRNLSGLALLFPISLVALWWSSRERPDRAARELVVLWAAGLILATLLQRRFGNSAALGLALVSAWALHAVWLRTDRSGSVVAARAALVVASVACLIPTFEQRLAPARHFASWLHGAPIELDAYYISKRSLLDAGRWLRNNAGLGNDSLAGAPTPDLSVMAPWQLGHRLLYSSGLPMVAGNFGDDVGEANFTLQRRYFASAESDGAVLLDSVGARFVVVESLTRVAAELLGDPTLIRRLTDRSLHDLHFHRLRYSTSRPQGTSNVRAYRVFERVAGAKIVGRADPGTPVLAQILVAAGERALRIDHSTTADEQGWYRLRVAQAGEDAASGGWRIRSPRTQRPLSVPLEAVLEGSRVDGPDLGSPLAD